VQASGTDMRGRAAKSRALRTGSFARQKRPIHRGVRRLGRVVGCLLLVGLLACRARATSTTQPSDSQLEDERAHVSRGEDVGASLRAPEIEVDGAGLRVNREGVAPRAAQPRRIELLVTMRVGASAAELTGLLAKVMASPLMGVLRPKLRFAWTPRGCPSDGKFGHAR